MGWSRFFRRGRWDAERAKELQDYLAHEIDDNIARGMTPEDASIAAHRTLGNVTRIREEIYGMNTLHFIESTWQDLRFGLRLIVRNRIFAAAAILTLALGTGANAAIFQLVNAVRLRALPVERPQELATISVETGGTGRTGRFMSRRPFFSEPLWQALRSQQQGFSSVFAWGITSWNVGSGGDYRPAQGLYVSGNFFQALGATARIGRVFTDADDQKGCGSPGAVLTHGFWQSRYGGRPDAVGQPILLDGHAFEIIGITPPEFFGVEVGRAFDVAIPLCAEPLIRGSMSGFGRPDVWFLDIMGRLQAGWTIERANAQLATISPGIFRSTVAPRYDAETAKTYMGFTFTAQRAPTGVSGVRTAYQAELWVLLAATGLVLLIACTNLANLMLARATSREREIAVRLAIGASRQRVIRQMVSEALLLAAFGAAGGAMLARWLSQTLVASLSTESTRLFVDLTPDWRVFLFVAGLAVVACLLFGLAPAMKATSANPGKTMQAGGRSSTDPHERFALRRGLVVVQVALSLVLIVGGLLFGRSLQNLTSVDPGFRLDGILAVNVDIRRSAIPQHDQLQRYGQVMERVRAEPGVLAASEAFIVPLSGSGWNNSILIDGQKQDGIVNFNRVGGAYFRAMDTPLLAGRTFGPADRLGAPDSAIVNDAFAKRYFPDASPIGRTLQIEASPGEPQPAYRIVGLVRDTKYTDLREEFTPIVYLAASQGTDYGPFLDLVVRSDVSPGALGPALTQAVREVAPNSTVAYDTIRTHVRDSLVTERVMATLSGFFAGLAMLIAVIGLYGVMSYMVSRRKVEIGIRMALGADPRNVVRTVLGESGRLLLWGLVGGIGLALLSLRWAVSLLYGLQPWDPASFVAGAVLMGAVGLLAAWVPARRASRLTPTIALRED